MAFTCSNCGFESFSKLIYQDHNCHGESGLVRWARSSPSYHDDFVRSEVKFADDEAASGSPSPMSPKEELPLPGMVTEDDFRDPESAPFRCLCGFTAFSQMLYEDHECKYVIREAVKASVMASTTSRLKDAGLHVERQLVGSDGMKQGPQTVLVKAKDTEKVLFGPRPIEKDMSVQKLIERILEVRKQPWATLKLFHEDRELGLQMALQKIPERSLLLQAEMNSATLDIRAKKCFFNKYPDVITEVCIAPQTEDDFEADVKKIREELRAVCGRYRKSCSCITGDVAVIDAAALLTTLEEKPKSLSCVPLQSCLPEDQLAQLRSFLQKAKTAKARLWKHEAYFRYYVMGWTAGHKMRLSIISEDAPSRSPNK